jgi:hypothetical protein
VPPTLQLCGNDATNLVAAIATMPGAVQADVTSKLSFGLADVLDHVAVNVDPSQLQAPDGATLGTIMTRGREEREAILGRLPEERRAAAAASWQRANMAEYLSSTATPCS